MQTDFQSQLKTVASNIRLIRLQKGYTQLYMAYKLRVSQNAYSKLELGNTRLTVENLLKVAHVLEVEYDMLLN